MAVPFVDLSPSNARQTSKIETAIQTVLSHGQFILGPEVSEFEAQLGRFMGGCEVVSCANGTDALMLSLLALDIGPGDLVFCPSFTYVATAEAIVRVGAQPVFVDIDRWTYTMCPDDLAAAIEAHLSSELGKPAAIIAVDLFGQLADYPSLVPVARRHNLPLISDCAQALGAYLDGEMAPAWADIVTTSFYPTKPLGCFGDGGAILTHNRAEYLQKLRSLRFHGRVAGTSRHDMIGMNSRLDTLQAAILSVKLEDYPFEINRRRLIADVYTEMLGALGVSPPVLALEQDIQNAPIWSQYTIEVDDPAAMTEHLAQLQIGSARYYETPVHLETPYTGFARSPNGLPNTEAAAKQVLSLPISARLSDSAVSEVIAAIEAYASASTDVT